MEKKILSKKKGDQIQKDLGISSIGPIAVLLSWNNLWITGLFLATLTTAVGVVYAKHLDRDLHIELQKLQRERDDLHVEWSRLLLEQGTLASDARVEQVAREKLLMITPKSEHMVVIKP